MIKEITDNFTCVPIYRKVSEKINAYARISRHNECSGILLSPIGLTDGIVHNAILAPNQKTSPSSAEADSGEIKDLVSKLGYRLIGKWHSHGDLRVCHSGKDDILRDTIMTSVAGDNSEVSYEQIPACNIVIDREVIITSKNLKRVFKLRPKDKKLSFKLTYSNNRPIILVELEDEKTGNLERLLINDARKELALENWGGVIESYNPAFLASSGVYYSLVTNFRLERYAELGLITNCRFCGLSERILKNAKIKIIDGGEDFKEEDLIKEFEEKVQGFKKW